MIVPISINGVMSYFPFRKPTRYKFEDGDVPRIDFTAEATDWDPLDQDFAEGEGEKTYFRGMLVQEAATERVPKMIIREVSFGMSGIDVSSDENSGLMLESNANVSNEFTTTAMTNM